MIDTQARWIVYFMENPKITWMISGTPILRNLLITYPFLKPLIRNNF